MKLIGHEKDLKRGASIKFTVREGQEVREGFVVRVGKEVRAYWNRCRHVPLPLDWGDNDFWTEDGEFLLCKNHGALYDPGSGECVSGPCAGAFLEPVAVELKEGKIYWKRPVNR